MRYVFNAGIQTKGKIMSKRIEERKFAKEFAYSDPNAVVPENPDISKPTRGEGHKFTQDFAYNSRNPDDVAAAKPVGHSK